MKDATRARLHQVIDTPGVYTIDDAALEVIAGQKPLRDGVAELAHIVLEQQKEIDELQMAVINLQRILDHKPWQGTFDALLTKSEKQDRKRWLKEQYSSSTTTIKEVPR